ncbi:MAG: SPOR domain-containing protein [Cognatishimia sp.]
MITLGPKQSAVVQISRAALMISSLALLSACEQMGDFNLLKPKPESVDAAAAQTSTTFVERDVEAPEVFSVAEAGLWDGRPSLGGVWVAHPDVADPERVIIRNKTNGKFVIGALFRRERAIPGPRLQLSSDAAAALSMLAGQPKELEVTALRREEAPIEAPVEEIVEAADPVETSALDPIAVAASAIDKADKKPAPAPAATVEAAQKPKPAAASKLGKPFVQIGIFSVEANAKGTAAQMRSAGMVPMVKKQTSKGKTFWRVLVGPANSSSERGALIKKIHNAGFTDAYAVTH